MTSELGAELSTIARSGRADAALDALALLADAYFFQSAGLWTVGVAALHWRGGFGVPDTRAIPEELWGPELSRAIHEARVERAEPAPVGWSHGERPHVIVPLTSSEGVTRGVLIASAETLELPEDLVAQARQLAPLLEFHAESPRRIADELERDIGGSLWAALLSVQEGEDQSSKRAAAALRAALADLRATLAILRDQLPRVSGLAEAAAKYGEAYGLSVEHDGFVGEESIEPADRAALVAVVREALENAALHGRARHARVTAGRSEGDLLVLVVEDDGHGASAEELEAARVRGGLGVAAIEGHAMLRGGTVSVGPSELGGLRLEVALPGI